MRKILFCLCLLGLSLCVNACSEPSRDITLPNGFSLSVYSDQVPGARQMALGDKGTVFVGSKKTGRFYALIDANADYKVDQRIIIKNDLNLPTGVAFNNGDLFVSGPDKILRYKNIEDHLQQPPKPSLITNKLPEDSHHGMRVLEFGPDGFLYTAIGMPCNICQLQNPIMGSLLRINPDNGNFSIYAQGIRNSAGIAWRPNTADLWFTDNGRDWLGDDLPADEINFAPKEGLHFGFPFAHSQNTPEKDYYDRRNKEQTFTPPALLLQAHTAPLGLSFYSGKQFPAEYQDSLFVAQHGSWNRSTKVGYRILNIRFEKNAILSKTVFAQGWLSGAFSNGRPVDILTLKDGSILISDDKAGKIYRITYKQK
jgi:glucose/arabinose dehydrogenase